MKDIDNQSRMINRPAQDLYNFIADFQNFEKFLPDQVTNWNATETTCSFTIPNLGNIVLKMEKDDDQKNIRYTSTAGPAPFELLFDMKPEADTSCQLTLAAFADVPAFMLMMIKRPIKNFITILLDKVKEIAEQSSE